MRRENLSLLLGASAAVVLATASPAFAQSAEANLGGTYRFAVPAGDLGQALTAFSRASGVQVVASPKLLKGRTSRGVAGVRTAREALSLILIGTGLRPMVEGSVVAIVAGSETPQRNVGAARAPAANAGPTSPPLNSDGGNGSNGGEQIVVTGSRIARPELESAMPVSVSNMADGARFGRVSAMDVLALDPAIGVGNSLSSGEGGIESPNLRNLGTNRSLTLIDGQRRVSGSNSSSAVDIGMIPAGMIDRIEVVTGGAAAIYGADAVTGVVNVVTKTDIEGLNVSGTYGLSQHGDAQEYQLSVSTGGEFANGRGSFVIGGTYQNTDDVWFVDRHALTDSPGLAANPENTGPNDGIPDNIFQDYAGNWAIYLNYEPVYALGGKVYIISNGAPVLAVCQDGRVPTSVFNACPGLPGRSLYDDARIRGGMESAAILGRVQYEVLDNVRYTGNFDYSSRQFGGASRKWREDPRPLAYHGAGSSIAHVDNPLMPDAMRQDLLAAGLTEVRLARTWGNLPMRTEEHHRQSFTTGQSLDGDLGSRFRWRGFWQYGRTQDDSFYTLLPYDPHWLAARDVIADPVTGAPVCRDAAARAAGCVPLNIFSTEPLSQEVIDYVTRDRSLKLINTQEIYGANISGNPISLPYGEVSAVVGVEHRKETLTRRDDPLAVMGLLSFDIGGSTIPDISAAMNVTEAFGELVVPVLRDLPFAERLTIEGAYRYSDYDTIGETNTWKAGATWTPLRGITFRGVRSRAVRVPNFAELYSPQATSNPGFQPDPCGPTNYHLTPTRAANCAALGIETPLTNLLPTGPLVTTGGNPDLEPETSNSLTTGVVLQPRFLPGFDLTLDYWNIDIDDIVSSLSMATVLNLCVDSPSIDNDYCRRIVRDEDGRPLAVDATSLNISRQVARGIDIGARYRRPLANGILNVSFKGTYLLENVLKTQPGFSSADVVNDGGWQNPRFVATLMTAYDIGDFSIALNARFRGASLYDTSASDETYSTNRIPAYLNGDFSIRYDITENNNIIVGVKNITDVDAPFFPSTFLASSYFDVIGRYFFTSVNLKF